jgi:hypothetical protein
MSSTANSTHAVTAFKLTFWRERCEKFEEKCLILENQRRQIESLGQLPGDVTKVLNQTTRRIATLKRKLEDRANLERYLPSTNLTNAVSNSQSLIGLFQKLKDSIKTVLVTDGDKEYPIENLRGISDDLDALLSSVFGTDTLCESGAVTNAFPIWTSSELTQALTGASIKSWVFEADFKQHMMSITPLLQEYRRFIVTCCKFESITFPREKAYVL